MIDEFKKNNNEEDLRNDLDENKNRDLNDNGYLLINSNDNGTIINERNARMYIILGWVCAALTFMFTPLFAIGGVIFGVLLNKQVRESGNILIITNIVLAIINIAARAIFLMLGQMILY